MIFLGVRIGEKELKCLVERSSFEMVSAGEKGEGKVIRKAKFGDWKEAFSDEEKRIMNSVMGETLRSFGYDV